MPFKINLFITIERISCGELIINMWLIKIFNEATKNVNEDHHF